MSRFLPVAVLLGIAAIAGCRKDDDAASSPSVTPSVVAPPAAPATTGRQAGSAAEPSPADRKTPALRVATIDGATFDLSAHRDNWVVVNFWATWCAPCLKEMPELSALDAMREHIVVVGLAYEEIEPAAMRAFLKVHPVVYPIAIVDPYAPPADFDTPRGLPMTYLIAPGGKVAKKILGPVTARELEAAISRAGAAGADAAAAGAPLRDTAPPPPA